MLTILLNEDIKPLSEFRAHTAAFIQQVHNTKRPIVITQHGKSSAILIDVTEYESLLEKLEVLEDIRMAEQDIEAGRVMSHAKAKQKLLAAIKK
jgi:antitoxin YefM